MAVLAGETVIAGKVPTERVATDIATSDSATFTTTETEVQTVTAPLVTGRTYRVRWLPAFDSNVTDDEVRPRVREDNVSGTQLTEERLPLSTNNRFYGTVLEAEYTASSTVSKTFSLTAERLSGSGSVAFRASATRPSYAYVDYIRGP